MHRALEKIENPEFLDEEGQNDSPLENLTSKETRSTHEELLAALNDPVNRMKNQPYYVFGCNPRAISLKLDYSVKSEDLYRTIKTLMEEGDPNMDFVIADRPLNFNIEDNIRKILSNSDASLGEERIKEIAGKRARLIGVRDALFISAIQEYIIGEDRGENSDDPLMMELDKLTRVFQNIIRPGEPKPKKHKIYLMSDFVEGSEKFKTVFNKVEELVVSDKACAKKFLKQVPKPMIKKITKLSVEQLLEDLENNKETILGICKYTIFQVAIVLLSGKKYGHSGERSYDKLVKYIFNNHTEHLGIEKIGEKEFAYPEIEGTKKVVPYRSIDPQDEDGIADSISPRKKFSKYEGLEKMNYVQKKLVPIWRKFFQEIQNTNLLSEFHKKEILRIEAIKMMSEMIENMKNDPVFNELLERSGLRKMAEKRKNFSEVKNVNTEVPFKFPEVEESDEGGFIRAVAAMTEWVRGPMGMYSNYYGDAMIDSMWKNANMLYEILEGQKIPQTREFFQTAEGEKSQFRHYRQFELNKIPYYNGH